MSIKQDTKKRGKERYKMEGLNLNKKKTSMKVNCKGCHQKTRGIFFAMCTTSLLDIHELKYVSEIFIEV
jgi:hypothetical protein